MSAKTGTKYGILAGVCQGRRCMTKSLEIEEARGWSKLLIAAEKGDVEAIQSELAAGADINESNDDGWSALHLSALNAHTAAVEALIEHRKSM